MRLARCLSMVLLAGSGLAASRDRAVVLGKWHTVKILADSGESEVKIRRLLVDGRTVEYTSGPPHDVTDRLFVVRRAYRINDALPSLHENEPAAPQWTWRLGGWISVDRLTGRVAPLNLPGFDAEVSQASWYRDYAAYCGTSEDGAKAYLVVWQLGKRKPILKQEFSGPGCSSPLWERTPSRVTFVLAGERPSFVIRSRGADPQPESNEEEGPQ
jgi:hypothetical protein